MANSALNNIFNLLRARAKISGSGRPEINVKFEALGKPEAQGMASLDRK